MRTSAASRSALWPSLNPRWASTTARNASSGLAKFELVDNLIANLSDVSSVVACGPRQRGVERCWRRVTKTCGDIAVGAQQIGRAGFGIVTCRRKPRGIGKAALAADTDHADAVGRIDRGAIAKLKQGEPGSATDEGVGQINGFAGGRGDRRIQHRSAGPRAAAPDIAISGRKWRIVDRG